MNIRIFTLACLFASALFPGMAGALDGTGSGTLEETILIKGCDNGLEYGDVTAFSIHTLGDWSLSTTEADYAGNYTLKKVKKKKKQGYAFNLTLDAPSLDALIDELGESVNQLCGRAPDTLAITQASVTKFIAKLSTDRTTLTLKLALAAKASDGTVTYSPKYNLLAQLAFTPTGGGIGGKVAGQVLAPDGQIAAAEPPGLLGSLTDFLLPPSEAAVSGLMKVPNGTPVELVHLSQAGSVDGVLATTRVYKGKYKFNLDRLGHFDAPDLAVRVSDRGVVMRAFLNAHTVNISPLSEAVFQLALEAMLATPGALLEHFTFTELDDLYASVDLLTSLEGLTAVPGVDATVAAIKDLVAQDPCIVTFLTAIAEVGQTDTGPGDIGNLFPLEEGNTWFYIVTSSIHNNSYTEQSTVTGSIDVNGTSAMVLRYVYPQGYEQPFDEYLEENNTGLYNWGNTIPDDFITSAIAPYKQESFPLKVNSSIEVVNLVGLVWEEDLDYDGQYEHFDVLATINTLGIESIAVPAGRFPVAVKQEIVGKADITLSRSGKHVKATEKITQWLVSRVGPVKVVYKITVKAFGETSSDTLTSLLSGYRVDGESGGELPAMTLFENLASGNDHPAEPGTPAIGTDGINYLILSCRTMSSGEPSGIIGRFLTPKGAITDEFLIAQNPCRSTLSANIAVAFDGTNYLVTHQSINGFKGVRVSTTGDVLDPNGGFSIESGGSMGPAKIAFDGTNYLAVWSLWVGPITLRNYDIYGSIISPSGEAGMPFEIISATGHQDLVDIAFDGTNYMIVWRDTQAGRHPGDQTDIYAARITPDGDILDPLAIPVATAVGAQDVPRIAFDGTNYFVVWLDIPVVGNIPPVANIYGRRLNKDGVILDGHAESDGIAINIANLTKWYLAVTFDGTDYLVAWNVGKYNDSQAGIHTAQVSTQGELLAPDVDDVGISLSGPPNDDASFANTTCASNGEGAIVAWLNNVVPTNQQKSIQGKFVYKQ